jgi:hypothetical protein
MTITQYAIILGILPLLTDDDLRDLSAAVKNEKEKRFRARLSTPAPEDTQNAG